LVVLDSIDLLVKVYERQVALGGNVDMSAHSLEIDLAYFCDCVVALAHVLLESFSHFFCCVDFEAKKLLMTDRNECFFRPR
jgi:hypothetical protein